MLVIGKLERESRRTLCVEIELFFVRWFVAVLSVCMRVCFVSTACH